MDAYKDFINWVPQTVLCGILGLIAVLSVKIVKFVVHDKYKELIHMLTELKKELDLNKSSINNISEQFKDGLNEIKLQMKGMVQFGEYREFTSEIKEEISIIREKIARLENR